MNLKNSNLYKSVLSDTNIFNAIYALESYVYEKGLLSDKDIERYYRLTDKFDFLYISEVISMCKERLVKVLTDERELFDVQVYFKLKKYDDDASKVVYRPIHSADLIDQICMVSLLNTIMYEVITENNYTDEQKEEGTTKGYPSSKTNKKLSGLARLLPSNFFGNIPSSQTEKLFVDWKSKYKEYSDIVINKYYEYSNNNKYSHEVCLDIKEFFPNINPRHIFDFIIDKLSLEFNDEDKDCLQIIVSKLLYFRLSNMDGTWSSEYYGDDPIVIDGSYYCRGIAQGLPQSYFFGNICMIEIAKCIEKCYFGDAYYYVDDSVIYTNDGSDRIEEINSAIGEIRWALGSHHKLFIEKRLQQKQSKYKYSITIHQSGGKSTITPISEAYNGLTSLKALAGLTSNINNAIYLSIDEIEDTSTEKKIEAIIDAINLAKEQIKKKVNANVNPQETKSSQYNLKLLNRYKKFFLFRLKLIQTRGDNSDNSIDFFSEKYQLTQNSPDLSLKNFFDKYEEDIFHGEIRLLLSMVSPESSKYQTLIEELNGFDCRLARKDKKEKSLSMLYLSRDINGSTFISKYKSKKYNSLQIWAESRFRQSSKIKTAKLLKQITNSIITNPDISIFKDAKYATQAFTHSNEYKRCLLNAIISQILNIPLSDDLVIYKRDNRSVRYYELRLLLFARNRFFKYEAFIQSAFNILKNAEMEIDTEVVDYKIVDVLHIFIAKINDPEKVDSLILIHRMVNGLWKNGSKFLHFYTLHNEEHSIELIKNVVRLVNTIDYFSLKKLDFYILFLACYLHDISLVIHPDLNVFCLSNSDSDKIYSNFMEELCDNKKYLLNNSKPEIKQFILEYFKTIFDYFENSVRNTHAKQSAKFIIDRCDTSYLKFIDNTILQMVAEVSEAHGYDCEEVYGRKSFAKSKIHSLKYMMILIRMADLLDLSKDRVSYYIMKENIKHMSKSSQFHWISHYITDNCNIRASFESQIKKDTTHKTSKIQPLDTGSIIEKLSFDIYLNTKQITTVELSTDERQKFCSKIECRHLKNENKFSIDILSGLEARIPIGCNNTDCAFMCKWITIKHEYLFSELHALSKYLNTVNKGLFKTKIEVNILYENKRELDPEFMDIAMNYILSPRP